MPYFRSKFHCRRAVWVIRWEAHNGIEKSSLTAIMKCVKIIIRKQFIALNTRLNLNSITPAYTFALFGRKTFGRYLKSHILKTGPSTNLGGP